MSTTDHARPLYAHDAPWHLTAVSRQKNYILGILVFIMPICGLTIDVYASFLPVLVSLFKVTESAGKLSISIYLLGFGLGQALIGCLSDRYGRKKTLVGSLVLFGFSSLLITFSTSMTQFLIFRFMQGLTVAGQIINIRTIVVDLFEQAALRKASISITAAWTASPIFGSAIGGYLYIYCNWKAAFYFLFVYSCIAIVLVCSLVPETNKNYTSGSLKTVFTHYKVVLHSMEFMKNVLGLMLGFSIINTFNVLGPFLVKNSTGVTPLLFSYSALLIGSSCLAGTLINHIFIRTLSIQRVIKTGLIALVTVSFASAVLSFLFELNVFYMVLFCSANMFIIGVIYPNYSANCSSFFKSIAGTAMAVRGVITMVGTSIITGIISLIHISSIHGFLTIYLALAALSLLIFFIKSEPNMSEISSC